MVESFNGELLIVSFKPKFFLIYLVRFFISLVLILSTVSVIESLKGGKMFKTVGIVES
jgi:hypothetical protein